jgi:hypothetical protein
MRRILQQPTPPDKCIRNKNRPAPHRLGPEPRARASGKGRWFTLPDRSGMLAGVLQMTKIFLGLAAVNVALFAATIWTGFTDGPSYWTHFSVGAFTGIYTCLTHSIVLMHFMGSGKAVKEAVEQHRLPDDPQTGYVRRTRRFKARSSPHATFGPILIIAAVCLGGWLHGSGRYNLAALHWHRWVSWFAIAYNLYAFAVEYRVIAENTAMIREINDRIAARSAESAPQRTL